MKPPSSRGQAAALAVLFILIPGATVAGFASRTWLSEPASAHAAGVDATIRYLFWATGALFLIGHLVLASFIWSYGRGVEAGSPRTSARAERWWSLLPVLVMALVAEVGVLAVGLPVWAQIYSKPPEDALFVHVYARQFNWTFRYAGKDGVFGRASSEFVDEVANPVGLDPSDPAGQDDIVEQGALHLPKGRHAVLKLRSQDVLHSFSVPQFRVKQDVVPGITGSTQFVPVVAGEFNIACAEVCGLGHYRMSGRLIVEEPEEFERWLGEQKGWFQQE